MRQRERLLAERRQERLVALTLAVTTALIAAVTWLAVTRSSEARDADNDAIAEYSESRGHVAFAELRSRTEDTNEATYVAATIQARTFDALADQALGRGDRGAADTYRSEAATARSVAGAAPGVAFTPAFQTETGFDRAALQSELLRQASVASAFPRDAARSVESARAAHRQAQLLSTFVAGFAVAVLLVAVARLTTGRLRARVMAASWSLNAALVIASVVVAFWGSARG